MEYAARIEEYAGVDNSFAPEAYPANVSQCPLTHDENQTLGDAEQTEEQIRASKTRRYLPCHYFDYICGSSTGA
jgi:hypothetical protein